MQPLPASLSHGQTDVWPTCVSVRKSAWSPPGLAGTAQLSEERLYNLAQHVVFYVPMLMAHHQ